MADYYHQVVFDRDIPASAMTALERLFLEAIFQSEASTDGIYFFAESAPNSFVEIDAKVLAETLAASLATDPQAHAVVVTQAALKEEMNEDGTLPEDTSELLIETESNFWEAILQDICKRNPSIDDIAVHHAFTCSRMRSDGFGGAVTRVTATKIEGMGTFDLLETMRKADKKAA